MVPQRRKSIMMDSSLRGFQNMIDNTEEFMEKEIEQLPIRLQDRWFSLKRSVAETQSQSRCPIVLTWFPDCSHLVSDCSHLVSDCSHLVSDCSHLVSDCSHLVS